MAEDSGEKTVPEKDLIAAKKSAESKIEKLEKQIEDLKSGKDSEYQARLTAEGSLKKLEGELAKAKTSLGELDKAKADLALATKSRDELSKSVIDLTRKNILDAYELSEDVQKKLGGIGSLEELQSYAKILEDVGKKREPGQKFAGAAGAGGVSLAGKTGRQLIKEGLAQKD